MLLREWIFCELFLVVSSYLANFQSCCVMCFLYANGRQILVPEHFLQIQENTEKAHKLMQTNANSTNANSRILIEEYM